MESFISKFSKNTLFIAFLLWQVSSVVVLGQCEGETTFILPAHRHARAVQEAEKLVTEFLDDLKGIDAQTKILSDSAFQRGQARFVALHGEGYEKTYAQYRKLKEEGQAYLIENTIKPYLAVADTFNVPDYFSDQPQKKLAFDQFLELYTAQTLAQVKTTEVKVLAICDTRETGGFPITAKVGVVQWFGRQHFSLLFDVKFDLLGRELLTNPKILRWRFEGKENALPQLRDPCKLVQSEAATERLWVEMKGLAGHPDPRLQRLTFVGIWNGKKSQEIQTAKEQFELVFDGLPPLGARLKIQGKTPEGNVMIAQTKTVDCIDGRRSVSLKAPPFWANEVYLKVARPDTENLPNWTYAARGQELESDKAVSDAKEVVLVFPRPVRSDELLDLEINVHGGYKLNIISALYAKEGKIYADIQPKTTY